MASPEAVQHIGTNGKHSPKQARTPLERNAEACRSSQDISTEHTYSATLQRKTRFEQLIESLRADFQRWSEGCIVRMVRRGEIELRLLDFRYYLLTVRCRWLFGSEEARSEKGREEIWEWWKRVHIINQLELMKLREVCWRKAKLSQS